MKTFFKNLCKLVVAEVKARRRLLAFLLLPLFLVSCGGETAQSTGTQSRTLASVQVLAGNTLSVTGMEKIKETRVDRTTFDYQFRLTLKNTGPAVRGARVVITSVGKGSILIKGILEVGSVAANTTIQLPEAVVIRHDRTYAFDPASVTFDVTSSGPDEPPTGTQKAEATLLPGVRVLNTAESGLITGSTDTALTFSRDPALAPGSVFIANGTAYKSIGSSTGPNGTVVTVGAPSIEEIFSKVEIRGKYVISDEQVVAESPSAKQTANRVGVTAKGTVPNAISDRFLIDDVTLTGSASITGTLTVDADYLYDKSMGGLQTASLIANVDVNNTIDLDIKATGTASKLFNGKSYYVPIRLSLYDGLLNAVGIHVAGIFIPTGVEVSAVSNFQATSSVTSNFRGTATASYANGSSTASFKPTGSVNVDVPTVSGVASVQRKIDGSVYLNLRPALALLNKVALAGVDLKLGPRVQLGATLASGTPPFCLKVAGFAHAEANFYFKTIGTNIVSSPAIFELPVLDKPLFGTCRSPTTVQIVSTKAATTPALFGESIDVSILVQPQPGHTVSGKVPTGEVTINAGIQSCTAVLRADGTGSCSLTPDQAGAAVPFNASYPGDTVYESSTGDAKVTINGSVFYFPEASSFPIVVPIVETWRTGEVYHHNFNIINPLDSVIAVGLDGSKIFKAVEGVFPFGSATIQRPGSSPSDPLNELTVTAANGIMTITERGSSTTAPPAFYPNGALAYNFQILHVLTFNMVTGEYSLVTTGGQSVTAIDSTGYQYSNSSSYKGDKKGRVVVKPIAG